MGENASPRPSPVLDLQAGLSEAFSAHADGAERRWPVIATLGFVGASCAVFWIVIGYGAARLLG